LATDDEHGGKLFARFPPLERSWTAPAPVQDVVEALRIEPVTLRAGGRGVVAARRIVDHLVAGCLAPTTKPQGLSLADRTCLALAARLGVPALTTDSAWADAEVAAEVKLIR
jgi:PIN domain nuclease of toxin-antitoxin system